MTLTGRKLCLGDRFAALEKLEGGVAACSLAGDKIKISSFTIAYFVKKFLAVLGVHTALCAIMQAHPLPF